ncbi:hypothetical protein GCM10027294_51960 [Marinactinospora endophytica]
MIEPFSPAGREDEHYGAFCCVSEQARQLGLNLIRESHRYGWEYTLVWPDGRSEEFTYLARVQARLSQIEVAR